MKRHPALAPLSRDHHHALYVAMRLRRASEETATEARALLAEFWPTGGETHFAAEEAIILPVVGDHPLGAAIAREHAALRAQVAAVVEEPAPAPERLHELGRDLAAHVRLEEHELFPLLERTLDDAALERLAAETEAYEAGHRCS